MNRMKADLKVKRWLGYLSTIRIWAPYGEELLGFEELFIHYTSFLLCY